MQTTLSHASIGFGSDALIDVENATTAKINADAFLTGEWRRCMESLPSSREKRSGVMKVASRGVKAVDAQGYLMSFEMRLQKVALINTQW